MIVSGDMRSEMEAMRRRLDEQGQRLEEIESKLERLRNWMMQNVGRGKWM
jgi:tetrahydromethanopterin S-methyltransferase subunit G